MSPTSACKIPSKRPERPLGSSPALRRWMQAGLWDVMLGALNEVGTGHDSVQLIDSTTGFANARRFALAARSGPAPAAEVLGWRSLGTSLISTDHPIQWPTPSAWHVPRSQAFRRDSAASTLTQLDWTRPERVFADRRLTGDNAVKPISHAGSKAASFPDEDESGCPPGRCHHF